MPKSSRATAARRARLTRERVLEAAIDLADASGIEALTMRRLGQALGVEAMSLYNHVANKDDILAGIIDLVFEQIDLAPTATDWQAGTRRTARSARAVLSRHRWAGSLLFDPLAPGPARLRYMDTMLGRFREAGFSVVMAHHALHAVDGHVNGYALQQANFPLAEEEAGAMAAAFLDALDATAYPWMAEHVRYHVEVSGLSDEADFEFGLDLILDGLERLRTGSAGQRQAPRPPLAEDALD